MKHKDLKIVLSLGLLTAIVTGIFISSKKHKGAKA